jgi:hypothetical protein
MDSNSWVELQKQDTSNNPYKILRKMANQMMNHTWNLVDHNSTESQKNWETTIELLEIYSNENKEATK